MRLIRAEEHGLIPLPAAERVEVRADVLKHAWVNIRPATAAISTSDQSVRAANLALYAGSMAGLLPLTSDLSVLVEPRFPLSLTEMVSAVGHSGYYADALRHFESSSPNSAADWMLHHLVVDLLGQIEQVVEQGLHREYVLREEDTSSPKGRILVRDTLRQHYARAKSYKSRVSFFERTAETKENYTLRDALLWILKWTTVASDRRQLERRSVALLFHFRHLPAVPSNSFTRAVVAQDAWRMPEARDTYRRALPLAVALLDRRGFSLDAAEGELPLSSLLIKTDEVFEDYVFLRLSGHLTTDEISVIDGNKMPRRPLFEPADSHDVPSNAVVLDTGSSRIQPDILIEREQSTLLVIDVKYKPVKAHADREDVIEQLVTYAARLRCSKALSVHPARRGQSSGLYVSGSIGDCTVYNYRIQMGDGNMEDEMKGLAKAVRSLL